MDRLLICIFMKSMHMHVLCEYIHMYSMDMYVDTCTGQRSILMSFLQSCLPCFPEPGPSGLEFTKKAMLPDQQSSGILSSHYWDHK